MTARLAIPLALVLALASTASEAACRAHDDAAFAAAIAAGHAYDKHVMGDHEFTAGRRIAGLDYAGTPIASRDQYAALIDHILEDHATRERDLSHDRRAFWDQATGTVVIVNPHGNDCGTAFRPGSGERYFDRLN